MRSHDRKRHRLDPSEYRGEKAVVFTACIDGRHRVFVDDVVYEQQVEYLRRAAGEFGCLVPIFCFMPDHAHILMKGMGAESDLLAAMNKYKLLSSLFLRRRRFPDWQDGFYDRILRPGEFLVRARYIAMNPVRAGLVENWHDYPYLGSLHGRVQDVFPD